MIRQEVKPPSPTRLVTYGLSLVTGPWRHLFDSETYRIMVAEALNLCVHLHKLDIAGYLVTERRIFLVLRIEKNRIPGILDKFSEYLEAEIRKQKKPIWKADLNGSMVTNDAARFKGLFEPFVLRNGSLKKLLTGRHIDYPYSLYVTRLKYRLSQYNFCSVMDYAGAEGPVKIRKLPKENVKIKIEKP